MAAQKAITCSRSRAKTVALWSLAAFWAGFIFFMSAHTGTDLDQGNGLAAQVKRWLSDLAAPVFGPDADAVSIAAHFMEYAVFGALLFVALFQLRCHGEVCRRDRRAAAAGLPGLAHSCPFSVYRRLWLLALAAIALASLYGASDEFHQLFVPGRMCDPADWLTDTCGAALGSGLAALFTTRHR